MLQMRPWKMSLLLGGNNNSKFQLPRTLQSSALPSGKTRRGGETGNISIDFFNFYFSTPHSCSLLPHPTEYHPPAPSSLSTYAPHSQHAMRWERVGDKGRSGGGSQISWAGHCPWGKMPSPGFSFQSLFPSLLLAVTSSPPSPCKCR